MNKTLQVSGRCQHKAPTPTPVEEPLEEDHPHPIPIKDPVPDHNPEIR